MVFFLIDIGCLGYLIAFVTSHSVNLQKSLGNSLVIIIGFIFFILTGIIVDYYFAKDYFVETVWELLGYK
jgi:hypothetical protein